jgi:hypothetical protein
MSGYGVPIVFGGVWGISSVVCWGLAGWKKWRKVSDRANGADYGNNHTDGEDTERAKPHPRLLE